MPYLKGTSLVHPGATFRIRVQQDNGMKGDRDLVHKTHSEADKNTQSVRDSYSDSSKFSEFLRKLMRTS
jgi:hypothetical protein